MQNSTLNIKKDIQTHLAALFPSVKGLEASSITTSVDTSWVDEVMVVGVYAMGSGVAGVSGFGFGAAFDLSLGVWPLATLKFRHLSWKIASFVAIQIIKCICTWHLEIKKL